MQPVLAHLGCERVEHVRELHVLEGDLAFFDHQMRGPPCPVIRERAVAHVLEGREERQRLHLRAAFGEVVAVEVGRGLEVAPAIERGQRAFHVELELAGELLGDLGCTFPCLGKQRLVQLLERRARGLAKMRLERCVDGAVDDGLLGVVELAAKDAAHERQEEISVLHDVLRGELA